jgi:hypothetical protein
MIPVDTSSAETVNRMTARAEEEQVEIQRDRKNQANSCHWL